jgi:pimeloyl-ACP methyl ester carboxylesterase
MPMERIHGFDMYYEVAGQGVPLLFVHGGLGGGRGSALFRQHHMPALAQYAHVIAFDRRAAGFSETPTTDYSFEGFVADMVALLDHLEHERAILMGHSAGGPQVLQCALTHPERVIALILSSTATQTVHVPPALASLVTFLGTEGLLHLQQMFARPASTPAAHAAVSAAPVEPLVGILQTYLAYHLHGDPIAARLQDIAVPVLILHGTADAELPFGAAEYFHAGLPTSALVPFVGGGHSILVTHAEPYRQAIIDFLQSLALAPSAAV